MKVNNKRLVLYGVVVIIVSAFAFPLFWMVVTSFKPESQVLSYPPQWIPETPTLDNYRYLTKEYDVGRWFLNSVIVATGVTSLTLAVSSLAGYAFARLEFAGKNFLFLLVIVTLALPFEIIIIPLFLGLGRIRVVNTHFALIMPLVANGMAVFIMRQFFSTLPIELEEAAMIDGCGRFRILWNIFLPLSTPALASVAILTFIMAWNDFLWPVIATSTPGMRTLPAGLMEIAGSPEGCKAALYGPLMAYSAIATLPIIVIFLALQRFFVRGIIMSGIKG